MISLALAENGISAAVVASEQPLQVSGHSQKSTMFGALRARKPSAGDQTPRAWRSQGYRAPVAPKGRGAAGGNPHKCIDMPETGGPHLAPTTNRFRETGKRKVPRRRERYRGSHGGTAYAQETVKLGYIDPLSGGGVGRRRRPEDVQWIADEINAQGGLLGKKIEILPLDSKTNPQEAVVRRRKAIDAGALHHPGQRFVGGAALSDFVTKYNERNPAKSRSSTMRRSTIR